MTIDDWTAPNEFGEYRILAPFPDDDLAFHAFDQLLERQVVVRFMGRSMPSPEVRQRFLVEARAAARVQHPNIVALYRVGELDGRPYMVSEDVPGRTLEQIEKPMPWTRALMIGVGLTRALSTAHRKGIVHGELRPSRAILGDDGAVRLADFGFARPIEQGAATTHEFLAPELWRGEAPSKRADVYALGAVLYELAAGVAPHGDVPHERLRVLIDERDPRPLGQAAPEVNPRFAAIVDRCLRRDPGARFPSAEELREALEQESRGATDVAMPAGNPYRGLRPFEAEHRAMFFGRNTEIDTLLERLRSESFVLVAGDSGVGKSSICRAGVLPRIAAGALGDARTWSIVSLVPGRHPVTALAAALAGPLGTTPDALGQKLREEPTELVPELRRKLGGAVGLLVFVDQMEELHTNSASDEAALADDLLARMVGGVAGVRLVATVRADFLTRVAALPRLGDEAARALYILRPLTSEKTREVVVGPAESTGIHFESEAVIEELVSSTANADGGLPLLQFALALLWEARDEERHLITNAALAAMGGVGGALARHGDSTVEALTPTQQAAARRVMVRLVTLENTRARRTGVELTGGDPVMQEALDALVRGRLVVAYEDPEGGSAYELAHEVLIREWGTLKRWLQEDAGWRAARERLAQAATEWERLRRGREGLWSAKQLAEVANVEWSGLSPREEAFLGAARSAVQRARHRRWAIAAAIPVLLAAGWGAMELRSRRQLERQVGEKVDQARAAMAEATARRAQLDRQRAIAFELFDRHERATRAAAEEAWGKGQSLAGEIDHGLARAGQVLEGALSLDPHRRDVRALLGDALYDRLALAELVRNRERLGELRDRLALYDADGSRRARWSAPAKLSVSTDPAGATLRLERYDEDRPGHFVTGPIEELGPSPITVERPPGSYRLRITAPGRAPVLDPVLLRRGETVAIAVPLVAESAVPAGFLYVPPGRYLFGTTADDESRSWFDTAPAHDATTAGFFIARSEITWADWIEFLRALPPSERARRMPKVGAGAGNSGPLSLEEIEGGTFRLTFQPGAKPQTARTGEPLHYAGRKRRADQDWLRFPAMGISAEDIQAYIDWLRTTGRVPTARLCTEAEWERAARGGDDREYPHGDRIDPDDANFDQTYDRDPLGMGPDEVGSHPATRSPFGVDDLTGNAMEWTTALEPGKFVVRGGSYFYDVRTIRLPNRTEALPTLRDTTTGGRLCATPPSRTSSH